MCEGKPTWYCGDCAFKSSRESFSLNLPLCTRNLRLWQIYSFLYDQIQLVAPRSFVLRSALCSACTDYELACNKIFLWKLSIGLLPVFYCAWQRSTSVFFVRKGTNYAHKIACATVCTSVLQKVLWTGLRSCVEMPPKLSEEIILYQFLKESFPIIIWIMLTTHYKKVLHQGFVWTRGILSTFSNTSLGFPAVGYFRLLTRRLRPTMATFEAFGGTAFCSGAHWDTSVNYSCDWKFFAAEYQ